MSSRPSRGAARLAAILDALPDALVLVNANGTVVNANSVALETFETPGTALVGRGLLDLLPSFDSRLIPGSMRRADSVDPAGRTKPNRMTARRTDGSEFPVEVTSANLENGQQAYDGYAYSGDELLMVVVRDLTGTVDTEAELARSQRQTEMILRAAAEGVVGTDTDGRVVLVNPAVAQILGYRASDLGGRLLHPLVLHSRPEGEPFPYEESPLADTLRSGRKHRVRGQVMWSKSGERVPVDLTTAPVRDGDQLVGAVLTFTDRRPYDKLAESRAAESAEHEAAVAALREEHAAQLAALREEQTAELARLTELHGEELAGEKDRYAALAEREQDRYEALDGRHEQLLSMLGGSLRGPLDELRRELSTLAADDAGQLWPEANQVLHHLAAGYARITTLVDNVLGYQRLETGEDTLDRRHVMLDAVVSAGVEGAVELIGPGRAQFAVHAPPIEAEVDPERLATALAHLVANVAGVDATGNAPVTAGGYMDSTIVVAAAQRGEVVRIEVRGPYAGGDPVHEPIVRGVVRAHGGVLQTHEVPGTSGNAYVLEVPIGGGAGAVAVPAAESGARPVPVEDPATTGGGRKRARRSSVDAFLDTGTDGAGTESSGTDGSGAPAPGTDGAGGTGRRRRRAAEAGQPPEQAPAQETPAGGTGRRRGRPSAAEGAVMAAGESAPGQQRGETVPPGGVPVPAQGRPVQPGGIPGPTGRRARREGGARALPAALPQGSEGALGQPESSGPPQLPGAPALPQGPGPVPGNSPALHGSSPQAAFARPGTTAPGYPQQGQGAAGGQQPTGRRRRALAAAQERAAAQEAAGGRVFALPPAEADRAPDEEYGPEPARGPVPAHGDAGQHTMLFTDGPDEHTPAQAHPVPAPTGRRRARPAAGTAGGAPQGTEAPAADGTPGGVQDPGGPGPQGAGRPRRPGSGARDPRLTAPGPGGHPAPGTEHPHGNPAPHTPAPPADPQPTHDHGTHGRGTDGRGTHGRGTDGRGTHGRGPDDGRGTSGRGTQDGSYGRGPQGGTHGQGTAGQGAAGQGALGAPGAPGPHQGQAAAQAPGAGPAEGAGQGAAGQPGAGPVPPAGTRGRGVPSQGAPGTPPHGTPSGATSHTSGGARPPAQPLPAEAGAPDPDSTQGRAISVRTLGQGVPFGRRIAEQQRSGNLPQPRGGGRSAQALPPTAPGPGGAPQQPGESAGQGPGGRRRKLGTPAERTDSGDTGGGRRHPLAAPQPRGASSEGGGRSYAIGAPDVNADEGPEPLDGPGGAVEIAERPRRQHLDDELPPEPLDNPRRLLVWPAPDMGTQQALSDCGYRPVTVHSREEVDAQIAAFPAALFVDPLTGPITRTALQSLRQAAVAAEVPVLVTAGLGQATREAAYGADPAVLLKALAPRDSEQHPPRVLLIEQHEEIALALTATLERRGMQVARAASDQDAVRLAAGTRPNLVVMDLMQVRREQSGIVDWLRANGQLNRTPLVVYTAAVEHQDLPRLAAGETVLFLAERSTSPEVQSRIVDLLARIGSQ
ncbi:PAS domain-containing protein [Streptomyces physcomitrii]|uniref:PAS domain-containing protein n=1 Tax=Streptomyces physcomitrii TaxID=2724184 RepID=UPI0033F915A3